MTISEKTKEVKELVYKIAKNIPFHFLLNVTINKEENEVTINDLSKIIVKEITNNNISEFRYYISRKQISFGDIYWTDEMFDYYSEPINIVQDAFEDILKSILYEATVKVREEAGE